MQCTVLLPALIWPDPNLPDIYRDLPLPNLQWLLGRARRTPEPLTLEGWLQRQLGLPAALPVAALTAAIDGLQVDGVLLRADPVHLQVNMEQLLLVPGDAIGIGQDDADSLIATLNRHFADDGLTFYAPQPQRWYVVLRQTAAVEHVPLALVAGNDIHRHLPQGPDALHWHGWLNEIQMLLYTHPANDAREQRGQPPINSVWFWGGGELPPAGDWPWDQTCGDQLLLRALARHAGTACQPLPQRADAWLQQLTGDKALLLLDQLQTPALYGDAYQWRESLKQLDREWFGPLRQALQQGRIGELELIAPGAIRASIGGSARWQFWRRPLPLSALAHSLNQTK